MQGIHGEGEPKVFPLQARKLPLRTLTARALSTGSMATVDGKRLFEALTKIDGLLLTQDLSGVDKLFTNDSIFRSDGITLPTDLKGLEAVRGKPCSVCKA